MILACGLVLILVVMALAVATVAVLSVTSKDGDQRDDGIEVLGQLGRILNHLLDLLRPGGGGPATA